MREKVRPAWPRSVARSAAYMKRPPPHHAGAGGNTKNQAATRNAIAANDAKVASSASVARSLLLECHAVHVGLAQLEAGALVGAVRGLARGLTMGDT